MNLCFFSGSIVSVPIFKFIISEELSFKHCRHISICMFELKLDDGTIVKVKAYDFIADYCYKNFRRGEFIVISGELNDLYEVKIDFCQII